MTSPPVSLRVCVIGAGPGGLAMARLLTAQGHAVTVLERIERAGGMCRSVKFEGRWFDVGANYVTKDYREVRALAKELDLTFVADKAFQNQMSLDVHTKTIKPVQKTLKSGHSMPAFLAAAARYLWAQFKYRKLVAAPGYVGVGAHTELMVPFATWLAAKRMKPLQKLFMIPITAMGFGTLDEIATPHALRYINARRFISMLLTGLNVPQRWPKRFTNGFGNAWKKVADELQVEYLTETTSVVRSADGVQVTTTHGGVEQQRLFDRLVVAIPPDTALGFLDATEAEKALFGGDTILVNHYSVNTATVSNYPWWVVNTLQPAAGDSGAYPHENGTPYIFGKQWKESELNLYYAPLHGNPSLQQVRARLEEVSNISTAGHPDSVFGQWQCSADWPSYFPRVSIPDMAGFQGEIGWYDQVETLQGQHHTYYCHGILSFELVELVMRYARHLVDRHFTVR